MAQADELQSLREELKTIQDQTRRSRKRAAFGFVMMLLLVIVSFVYAFVQQVAAARNAEEANRQHMLAQVVRKEADQHAEEARRQEALAKESRALAKSAAATLAACCKKK